MINCGCGCAPCQCVSLVNGRLPACPPRHPCECGCDPCSCPGGRGPLDMAEDVNPEKNCCTVCSGDLADNVWFVNGKCLLDELTYEQVWEVMLRNPDAKKHLQRITADPTLLLLARDTSLIKDEIEDDRQAVKRIDGEGLPFYKIFRGNTGGDII